MRYQNNQLYFECQLISLWNASRYYNIEIPKIGSKEYNRICDESRCIYGGCIDIEKEKQRLGLRSMRGKYNLIWVRNNLPVHFSIFCHRDYHSVLGIKIYKTKILLANYAYNRTHWISWKNLRERIIMNKCLICGYNGQLLFSSFEFSNKSCNNFVSPNDKFHDS